MSQYTDIMDILEVQSRQLDWCVDALKHLLGTGAGWQPEATVEDYEDDLDLEDEAVEDYVVPIHAPRAPQKPCPHNVQGVVDGKLTCLRCGFVWTDSGLVQNRVSPSGAVMRDPRPPRWATEQSRGASSKNPGGALVPFSD